MKSIGITGASGFIGRRLVNRLLLDGYSVTALVRNSKNNFPDSVTRVTGDLVTGKGIARFLKNVDCVVHLAARQTPPFEYMFQDNVEATHNLVTEAIRSDVKQLVYLSSAAVYGDKSEKILTENDYCFPSTEYGMTKYLAEKICEYWGTVTRNPVVVLRPFNIYGEGSSKGVVYNMVKSAKDSRKIRIYGDGKQSRDFLYVDDVINALVQVIKKEENSIYNLGSGENISLKELATLIQKEMKTSISIAYKPVESGKTKGVSYSLDKVRKELGWKASIALEEGIKKVIAHE